MKTTNILYWVFTSLFVAFMIFTSIGNVMMDPQSVAFISGKLGFPQYMIPFLGWAKIIGCVALLVPGFPRIKEWAYAGLFFDLSGALYAILNVESFTPSMLFMAVPFILMGLSYIFYHKKLAVAKQPERKAIAV